MALNHRLVDDMIQKSNQIIDLRDRNVRLRDRIKRDENVMRDWCEFVASMQGEYHRQAGYIRQAYGLQDYRHGVEIKFRVSQEFHGYLHPESTRRHRLQVFITHAVESAMRQIFETPFDQLERSGAQFRFSWPPQTQSLPPLE